MCNLLSLRRHRFDALHDLLIGAGETSRDTPSTVPDYLAEDLGLESPPQVLPVAGMFPPPGFRWFSL